MVKLADRLESVLTALAVGMFAFFIFSITYQVASRYIGFIPRYYWTEELSRVSFIWMAFLGASIGVKNNEHFLLDIFPVEPGGRADLIVNVVAHLVVLTIAVLTAIGAYRFTLIGFGRASSITGIGLNWYYLSILVSFVLMGVFTVLNIATGTLRHHEAREQ